MLCKKALIFLILHLAHNYLPRAPHLSGGRKEILKIRAMLKFELRTSNTETS
jgi:hypothetical protein